MHNIGPLILSYLSARDLLSAGEVSKEWQAWSEKVWAKNFCHPRKHYKWLAKRCDANDFCVSRKNRDYTRVGVDFLMATFFYDGDCGIIGALNYFNSVQSTPPYYGFSFDVCQERFMIHLFPDGIQAKQQTRTERLDTSRVKVIWQQTLKATSSSSISRLFILGALFHDHQWFPYMMTY
jgi:hypothetical protein